MPPVIEVPELQIRKNPTSDDGIKRWRSCRLSCVGHSGFMRARSVWWCVAWVDRINLRHRIWSLPGGRVPGRISDVTFRIASLS
jgi:hypothetical protein